MPCLFALTKLLKQSRHQHFISDPSLKENLEFQPNFRIHLDSWPPFPTSVWPPQFRITALKKSRFVNALQRNSWLWPTKRLPVALGISQFPAGLWTRVWKRARPLKELTCTLGISKHESKEQGHPSRLSRQAGHADALGEGRTNPATGIHEPAQTGAPGLHHSSAKDGSAIKHDPFAGRHQTMAAPAHTRNSHPGEMGPFQSCFPSLSSHPHT